MHRSSDISHPLSRTRSVTFQASGVWRTDWRQTSTCEVMSVGGNILKSTGRMRTDYCNIRTILVSKLRVIKNTYSEVPNVRTAACAKLTFNKSIMTSNSHNELIQNRLDTSTQQRNTGKPCPTEGSQTNDFNFS